MDVVRTFIDHNGHPVDLRLHVSHDTLQRHSFRSNNYLLSQKRTKKARKQKTQDSRKKNQLVLVSTLDSSTLPIP